MRKLVAVLPLVLVGIVGSAQGASAVELSPSSQHAYHASSASWGGAWAGNSSPFDGTFAYGDGTSTTSTNVTYTSRGWSKTWYRCYDTTFTQTLRLVRNNGLKETNQSRTYYHGRGTC